MVLLPVVKVPLRVTVLEASAGLFIVTVMVPTALMVAAGSAYPAEVMARPTVIPVSLATAVMSAGLLAVLPPLRPVPAVKMPVVVARLEAVAFADIVIVVPLAAVT
jgi:hypothetical protein